MRLLERHRRTHKMEFAPATASSRAAAARVGCGRRSAAGPRCRAMTALQAVVVVMTLVACAARPGGAQSSANPTVAAPSSPVANGTAAAAAAAAEPLAPAANGSEVAASPTPLLPTSDAPDADEPAAQMSGSWATAAPAPAPAAQPPASAPPQAPAPAPAAQPPASAPPQAPAPAPAAQPPASAPPQAPAPAPAAAAAAQLLANATSAPAAPAAQAAPNSRAALPAETAGSAPSGLPPASAPGAAAAPTAAPSPAPAGQQQPDPAPPAAAAPLPAWATYAVQSVEPLAPPPLAGASASAPPAGGRAPLGLLLRAAASPQQAGGFQQLSVAVEPQSASRLHVKVWPTGTTRWEVPAAAVPRPGAEPGLTRAALAYRVDDPEPRAGRALALTVLRKATLEPVFDTRGHALVFDGARVQLTTRLPASAALYGLGAAGPRAALALPRHSPPLRLWNSPPRAGGAFAAGGGSGSHPFYLQVNRDGLSHGVLMLNSNAMEVEINSTSLTYRMAGGVIDLYIFLGPTPEAVVRQYHQVIGRPALPPYWALGLHQARWGHADAVLMEAVAANYSSAQLPLEALWAGHDFAAAPGGGLSFDAARFPAAKLAKLSARLKAAGQALVIMSDAPVPLGPLAPTAPAPAPDAAAVNASGASEGAGAAAPPPAPGAWLQRDPAGGGGEYLGQGWLGPSMYADYAAAATPAWLRARLTGLMQAAPFAGVWLSAEAPASACAGVPTCAARAAVPGGEWPALTAATFASLAARGAYWNATAACALGCGAFAAAAGGSDSSGAGAGPLGAASLAAAGVVSPTARGEGGVAQADAHNLYGSASAAAHAGALAQLTGRRPFVVASSTFPGAGRSTGRLAGQSAANWQSLAESVAAIIDSSLHGMPLAGVDVCGQLDAAASNGDAYPPAQRLGDADYRELCLRWASAGAFYPLSVNGMDLFSRPHEFYRSAR